METQIKKLEEILVPEDKGPGRDWQLRMIRSEQCLSYVAWNERTKEALLIDPKQEDAEAYRTLSKTLEGYSWLGVVDTHTHADHVSLAAKLADELAAPLIMHAKAPSQRVHLRVAKNVAMHAQAAPVRFIQTPGHTPDSLVVVWGPFLFGGDTLLYGDTGRDDLPGGDAESHYDSILAIKAIAAPEMIVLPGHDHKGGRASTWATQLRVSPSLAQGREEFVQEASAFDAPAPKLLKKSLKENFK